jgi:hypothetical protein
MCSTLIPLHIAATLPLSASFAFTLYSTCISISLSEGKTRKPLLIRNQMMYTTTMAEQTYAHCLIRGLSARVVARWASRSVRDVAYLSVSGEASEKLSKGMVFFSFMRSSESARPLYDERRVGLDVLSGASAVDALNSWTDMLEYFATIRFAM